MARFGLFLHASDRQVPRDRLFEELSEEAVLAESVGFEACLIAEHHQSPNGHYPAPLMLAAAIAARTQRIRVGSSVLLAPLYHPVHLAEESAMLDVISSGRAILGLGIGYSPRDFDPFGVSLGERASRMEDHLRFLKQAWTRDHVSFDGKHYSFEDVSIHPKPVQQPHPPIWVGGAVPRAIDRAARYGDAWIGFPFYDVDGVAERAKLYRERAAVHGRGATVALRRDVWVAQDRDTAFAEYRPAIESFQRFMRELHSADAWFRELHDRDAQEQVVTERLLLGTPEDCVRTARRYIEQAGVDWFIMRFRQPDGPSHEKVMRAIELFGREVVSKLAPATPPDSMLADPIGGACERTE
ncbi:MAG: LLM class flavin-dependent oxidoreductase [Gammaproteobacteria bacterium]|nr:LLM class flavin-dependent oxidoreductase [Gammaproteobacteria bacterium]